MDQKQVELQINDVSEDQTLSQQPQKTESPPSTYRATLVLLFTKLHAGYFRISLSLSAQALLWKILKQPIDHEYPFWRLLRLLPDTAFLLLWSLALFVLSSLSILYLLRCFLHFKLVKSEFLHSVGVNYLFVPWISWILLLQCSPFVSPASVGYQVLLWVFMAPVVALDVKIYGQWFTKGKRFLSMVANPASQMSVICNFAGARAAAVAGWSETAVCMFAVGMAHYLVVFVTLYQRLAGSRGLPATLRPVFFLFIAAPSMASLAWESIAGEFDVSSKMLFFLSVFLFLSLVLRPTMFKKSMRKFSVAWWAYSFPASMLALASNEYAKEVKTVSAHILALLLSLISVFISLFLMIITVINSNSLIPLNAPVIASDSSSSSAEP